MQHNNQIDCIFYSHDWAIYNLEKLGVNVHQDTLVIELSSQSSLNIVLNDTQKDRLGIAALLNPHIQLDTLGEYFPNVPVKLILASTQQIKTSTLASATQLLAHQKSSAQRIILLVNTLEAAQLAETWQYADSFAIYWDLADPLSLSLALLGEKLAEYGCLSTASWLGLHFYQGSQRHVDTSQDALLASYQAVLQHYPALAAKQP